MVRIPDVTKPELPKVPGDRRFEMETVIRFDETGEPALVWTASKRVADKLIKAGLTPTRTTWLRKEATGWWFQLPTYGIVVKPTTKAIRIGIKKRAPKPEDLEDTEPQEEPDTLTALHILSVLSLSNPT